MKIILQTLNPREFRIQQIIKAMCPRPRISLRLNQGKSTFSPSQEEQLLSVREGVQVHHWTLRDGHFQLEATIVWRHVKFILRSLAAGEEVLLLHKEQNSISANVLHLRWSRARCHPSGASLRVCPTLRPPHPAHGHATPPGPGSLMKYFPIRCPTNTVSTAREILGLVRSCPETHQHPPSTIPHFQGTQVLVVYPIISSTSTQLVIHLLT